MLLMTFACTQDSHYRLAVEGLGSLENVDGDVIAKELGIDMENRTRDVMVVIIWVGGLFGLLLLSPVVKGIYRALMNQ
jgi:hypothetical protein